MPAIITHCFFGKDMLDTATKTIGLSSKEEKEVFVLGNQGPDPLFYIAADPRLRKFHKLGSRMHKDSPTKLIEGFRVALDGLTEDELPIGRAYAAGFLCHFALDSTTHPMIYSQQFEICKAGIEGLDMSDGSEVHAEIERDIDEAILYSKTGLTVEQWPPHTLALKSSPRALAIAGKVVSGACAFAYGLEVPDTLFSSAVREFRAIQRFAYSTGGRKRRVVELVELTLMRRRYSFYKSMSHRVRESADSVFDNTSRQTWDDPFTGETSSFSFWDLYYFAQGRAAGIMRRFFADGFTASDALAITRGLDFSGRPEKSKLDPDNPDFGDESDVDLADDHEIDLDPSFDLEAELMAEDEFDTEPFGDE